MIKKIYLDGQETNYTITEEGTITNTKTGRVLTGTLARNEYPTVQLSLNGKVYSKMIHRLVAEYFCPNPNNYPIVHHKDENKLNYRADNLEWVTESVNAQKVTNKKPQAKIKKVDLEKETSEGEWRTVYNYPNFIINEKGDIINTKTKRMLAQSERNGYMRAYLQNEDGKSRLSVHRLVYESFIGPIPENTLVDHIDGNRANNHLSNLRLVSQSENMYNAMRNGHSCQVPVLQYTKEGEFVKEYPNIQAAADAMGVTHGAVQSAVARGGTCRGFKWKRKEV